MSEIRVEAAFETAERTLPGADDPDQLDRYVDRYDAQGPTDEAWSPRHRTRDAV